MSLALSRIVSRTVRGFLRSRIDDTAKYESRKRYQKIRENVIRYQIVCVVLKIYNEVPYFIDTTFLLRLMSGHMQEEPRSNIHYSTFCWKPSSEIWKARWYMWELVGNLFHDDSLITVDDEKFVHSSLNFNRIH